MERDADPVTTPAALAGNRDAVDALLAAADRAAATWTVPRAPGKWSPSQVVEHVARIMDESSSVVSGAPSRFPMVPGFLRPVIRHFFFSRALRENVFPDGKKTIKDLDPASGSPTPGEARVRLEAALARFDEACRTRAARGQEVASTIFGAVPVAEFARFQELHIRHHLLQMPANE